MLASVLPRRAALASLASLALASSSCLVTSIDSFPDPPKTPPFLSSAEAQPVLRQLVLVDPTTSAPITFSAYVRSEDAGVPLDARLEVDWPDNARGTVGNITLGPGSFSEQRNLSFRWDPRLPTLQGALVSTGCHSFTLIVSHGFNFSTSSPLDQADADTLTWWVFVGSADNFASFDLSTCATTTQFPATLPTSTTQSLPPPP